MKRTLVALAAALAVTVGAVQAVPASAQTAGETSASSLLSGDEGSSAGSAAALVAVGAALGGGSWWAAQQGLIPDPVPAGLIPGSSLSAPAPPRGDCSPQAFNDTVWEWRDSNRTNVQYCDGGFAWVSQNQTDWRLAFEFDGQRWQRIWTAGTTKTGMTQGCYNGLELRHKGASENFIARLPICTPDEIGYSPW